MVTQSNGSKSDAALSQGFFVWRGPRLAKPSRLPDGTMAYGPDGRSTFRGHDAAGQVVVTLHDSP